MHPENIETGKQFGLCHGFKVFTGAPYFGGLIGDDESKRDWLQDCTLKWEKNIYMISKTMGKDPQDSYAAVVRAI